MTRNAPPGRRLALHTALALCAAAAASAHAAPLAYVASDGNDNRGRCTLTAPCRTFQAAHDAVDAGGQVVALDAADYGPLSISKSVSIVGGAGFVAGITVGPGGNGVTIAAAGADVVLKNLYIQGAGGKNGVAMSAGRSLTLEGCVVANLAGDGIHIVGTQSLSIVDTVTRGNAGHGAYLTGGTSTVVRSRFVGNAGSGLFLESGALGASASVSDSVASHNGDRGFSARAMANGTSMSLVRAIASRNGGAGFANQLVNGFAMAKMSIAASHSTYNAVGFQSTTSGLGSGSFIYSPGDNVVTFNQVDVDALVFPTLLH